MNAPLIHIPETGSTNLYLRKLLSEQPIADGTTVLTDVQTAGRGQRGNTWESEPYKNLTFSILLKPKQLHAGESFILSEIISLAITEVLENYASGFSIKWPNDIYWNDKKIAGILIENDLSGKWVETSIAGIGLNVNQKRFVSDAPNPVSLAQLLDSELNLQTILDEILTHIAALRSLDDKEAIAQRYKSKLYRRDGYYPFRSASGRFHARIVDVEPAGLLILETDRGNRKRFAFKEVSFEI